MCYNDIRTEDTVIRRRSSAGQSARFTSVRSWVRAPSSPPKTKRAQRALFVFAGCTPCDVPHRRRRLRFAPGWHRISLYFGTNQGSEPPDTRVQRTRLYFCRNTKRDEPHRRRRLRFALCGRILSPIFRNNSWGLLKYTVPYGIICYKMTHVCTSCLSVARDNRKQQKSLIASL